MKKDIAYYECTLCQKRFAPQDDLMTCPICGERGILDIAFDYDKIKTVMTPSYFNKPLPENIWRYLPLLTVDGRFTSETLSVGWTPLYESKRLAKHLGLETLYIKDDGQNPTQSLKDRASVIACLKAKEQGIETIACSSTGNAASSLAGNASRLGLNTVIFVPKRAPIGKLIQLKTFGSTLIKVNGDYQAAYRLSKAAIDHYQWYNRNAAVNPHLVEGKKTVALEIAEQLDFKPTDWVVVSVGDGCTIAGVYKGFYDFYQLGLIDKIPQLLGVQSQGCAPIYKAFISEKPLEISAEDTLADSIAVGDPRNPIKALNAVRASKGQMVTVSDASIMEHLALLGQTEGVFAEPAAAASLAGLSKALDEGIIQKTESVTVIITGNGLKDPNTILETIEGFTVMEPKLDDLISYMEKEKENDKNE